MKEDQMILVWVIFPCKITPRCTTYKELACDVITEMSRFARFVMMAGVSQQWCVERFFFLLQPRFNHDEAVYSSSILNKASPFPSSSDRRYMLWESAQLTAQYFDVSSTNLQSCKQREQGTDTRSASTPHRESIAGRRKPHLRMRKRERRGEYKLDRTPTFGVSLHSHLPEYWSKDLLFRYFILICICIYVWDWIFTIIV